MTLTSYKDLFVWQRAMELVVEVYRLTSNFPSEELYGLTSQMRRATISIPANIAEGRHRGTKKDFAQFLRIALSSSAELQTQLEIAKKLHYINHDESASAEAHLIEVMKMLNTMIRKLIPKS